MTCSERWHRFYIDDIQETSAATDTDTDTDTDTGGDGDEDLDMPMLFIVKCNTGKNNVHAVEAMLWMLCCGCYAVDAVLWMLCY
jgi:hypothetical protein